MIVLDVLATVLLCVFFFAWGKAIGNIKPQIAQPMSWCLWVVCAIIMGVAVWR